MRYIVFNKLRSIELRGRSYTARTTRYNVPASDTAGSMDASAPFPVASAVGIRVAVSSVRDGNNPYEDCQTSETPFFTPYDNTYQHADNRPPQQQEHEIRIAGIQCIRLIKRGLFVRKEAKDIPVKFCYLEHMESHHMCYYSWTGCTGKPYDQLAPLLNGVTSFEMKYKLCLPFVTWRNGSANTAARSSTGMKFSKAEFRRQPLLCRGAIREAISSRPKSAIMSSWH